MNENIKERLKIAMDAKGLKNADLCRLTGYSKSSISQYLTGYAEPKADRIYVICKALHISEAWLLGYDVPMDSRDAEKEEIISIYNRLDPDKQDMVLKMIRSLVSEDSPK